MESRITGKAYVLGDNIDTDQIIPAEYLSFNPAIPEERKFFGMYANSGVPPKQAGLPQGSRSRGSQRLRRREPGRSASQYLAVARRR